MQGIRRLAAVGAAVASLIVVAPASAGIWTPMTSGTTENITAVDYQAAGQITYTTAGGKIFKNGAQQLSAPGVSFNDVAFNPSNTVGLAAGSNGNLYRFNGATWTVVSLANSTYSDPSPCGGSGGPVPHTGTPTGNLNAVAWASDTTAYVVASDQGVVLKTTNGGASFTDVSRQADSTCFVDTNGDLLTDVKTIPGSDVVWFLADGFGTRFISANGLTSSAARQGSTSANCFDHRPQLALDPVSANRSFVTDRCNGTLQIGYSEDNGVNYEISHDYVAGDGSSLTGLNDVAIAGGSALAVGNGGAVLISLDGRAMYFQRAAGADSTNDWFAVDKLDATTAVIGGRNGKLETTTQATTIPDVVAPAGTVSGPTTATAGQPVTYTANVADNAGGSGIDAGSFAWSATGLPPATGNPVTVTFPSAGFYTLHVAFKDAAGNAGESSISVTVKAAAPATTPRPVATSANVPGAKITFSVPGSCVAPGKTFSVTLTWKKQKKKGNKFVKVRRADFYIGTKRVKIDTRAPFRQTLTVKASAKPGSTITLRARAYIKVKRGKSPTKSIKSKIKVCG
jgi:hypothetical protein